MSQDLQMLAQEALVAMQMNDEEHAVTEGKETSNSATTENELGTSQGHTIAIDKSSQPLSENSLADSVSITPEVLEAGTPPTQAEAFEPLTPVHEAQSPKAPAHHDGPSVDYTVPATSPISANHDDSPDALFEVDEEYEERHEAESPCVGGEMISQTAATVAPTVISSTVDESTVSENINERYQDESRSIHVTSPVASIVSTESLVGEVQPDYGNIVEEAAAQNSDLKDHQDDTNNTDELQLEPAVPNQRDQKSPELAYVESQNNQTLEPVFNEKLESPDLPEISESQRTIEYEEVERRAPVALMEVSPDDCSHQPTANILEDPGSTVAQVVLGSPAENSDSNSLADTEIPDEKGIQTPDHDEDKYAGLKLRPTISELEPEAIQEATGEPPKDPGTPADDQVEIQEPDKVSERQEEAGREAEQEVSVSQAQPEPEIEATKPKARKPLPTGPLMSGAPKKSPAPRGPRKRKLGIYEYSWESDPESYPKKSQIARPQPNNAKGRKPPPKPTKTNSKKRNREAFDEADGDASDGESLATTKPVAKKPRAQKGKEPKVDKKPALEKKTPQKRGPKPGARKKKKTEEVKPTIDMDLDDDSEFIVEQDEDGDSEDD
ncbi:hypothetical protein E8E14_004651 [Neopestalotiopsis sp. 37M]|nr:hypothetical protein E8E14_004651 [Neopestalotiopsis sp. 37M]